MSEYIVIKDKNAYYIIREEEVFETIVLPHKVKVFRTKDSGTIEGTIIGVFKDYSDAIRSTLK